MATLVSTSVRLVNCFFLALFLVAAAVQYNDPDCAQWMTFYLAAAATCVLALLNKSAFIVRLGVVVASIVFASKLIPTASEAYKANPDIKSLLAGEGGILMKGSGVEEARELGGILIVLAYQLIVFPFSGAVAAAVSDKTASTRTEKSKAQ